MIAANFSSIPMPVQPVDKFADDRNVRLPKLIPDDLIYEAITPVTYHYNISEYLIPKYQKSPNPSLDTFDELFSKFNKFDDLLHKLVNKPENLSSINVEPKFKHTDERNLDFRFLL